MSGWYCNEVSEEFGQFAYLALKEWGLPIDNQAADMDSTIYFLHTQPIEDGTTLSFSDWKAIDLSGVFSTQTLDKGIYWFRIKNPDNFGTAPLNPLEVETGVIASDGQTQNIAVLDRTNFTWHWKYP